MSRPPSRSRRRIGEAAAWKLKLAIADAAGKPQGRNIALWMSDDARRLPMKLQAELPIGSFSLTCAKPSKTPDRLR